MLASRELPPTRVPSAPIRSTSRRAPRPATALLLAAALTAALAVLPASPALAGPASSGSGPTASGVVSQIGDWLMDAFGLGDDRPQPTPAAKPHADAEPPSVRGSVGPFIDPNGHRVDPPGGALGGKPGDH